MESGRRPSLLPVAVVVALVLASLLFRCVFYFFDRAALELRYFWWLFLILGLGLWLLMALAPRKK